MNAKFFLKNNMSRCTAYNFSDSSKNNHEKTQFTFLKSECTRKSQIPTLNQKEDTLWKVSILTSNQLSAEHYLNVIALLCTAKTQRLQSLMGTVAQTDLTSSYCILDRVGSSISVAFSIKFFGRTVSGWESLAVVTKKINLSSCR